MKQIKLFVFCYLFIMIGHAVAAPPTTTTLTCILKSVDSPNIFTKEVTYSTTPLSLKIEGMNLPLTKGSTPDLIEVADSQEIWTLDRVAGTLRYYFIPLNKIIAIGECTKGAKKPKI
jgi:hypothetical protein